MMAILLMILLILSSNMYFSYSSDSYSCVFAMTYGYRFFEARERSEGILKGYCYWAWEGRAATLGLDWILLYSWFLEELLMGQKLSGNSELLDWLGTNMKFSSSISSSILDTVLRVIFISSYIIIIHLQKQTYSSHIKESAAECIHQRVN